jgi:hypothetical protein
MTPCRFFRLLIAIVRRLLALHMRCTDHAAQLIMYEHSITENGINTLRS